MTDTGSQRHSYFTEKELSRTLELSKRQFIDARRKRI